MKILKNVTKEVLGSEFKHLKSSFLEKGGEVRVQEPRTQQATVVFLVPRSYIYFYFLETTVTKHK